MAVDFTLKPIYVHDLTHDDNDQTLIATLADGTTYRRTKHSQFVRRARLRFRGSKARSAEFQNLWRARGRHTVIRLYTWDEREADGTEADFYIEAAPSRAWRASGFYEWDVDVRDAV